MIYAMRLWHVVAILIGGLIAALPAWANPVPIDAIEVLHDLSGHETIESVSAPAANARFRAARGGISQGFTNEVVWLRFQVQPPAAGEWWLDLRPITLDDVRLYEPWGTAYLEQRSGRLVQVADRDHGHPGFVFKLSLPDTTSRTYYLRLKSGSSVAARLTLWQTEHFIRARWTEAGGMGLLGGALLALLAFNVALWRLLGERALLWSAYYILSLGAAWFFWFGYGAELFLREAPGLNIYLVDVTSALYPCALSGLLYSLLRMVHALPARHWLFWLPAIQAVFFPIEFHGVWQPVVRSLCVGACLLWLLWLLRHTLLQCAANGDWSRRLLLATLANVEVCNVLMGLAMLGVMRPSGLSPVAYLLAGCSSLICIQMAMLLRIHQAQGRQAELSAEIQTAQAEMELQRASQKKLSDALLELDRAQFAGRIGCWRWDKAAGLIELSHAARKLIGDDPPESFDPVPAFHARLTEESRAALQLAMAGSQNGVKPITLEVQLVSDDTTPKWLELHGSAVLSADGRSLGMSGTLQDISERRALVAAKTAADAERLARTRESIFLSRASHELRTPLNAVMGLTQILAESPDIRANAALLQQATMIVQASDELRALIDDILDLATLQRDAAALPTQPVDVAPVLSSCIDLLQPLANARGITLRLAAMAHHSCASAHPDRLRQGILNLLRNAIQYNRAGGSVTVSLYVQDDASTTIGAPGRLSSSAASERRLCIDVKDTGLGMTPSQRQSLFEPFNRLGAELTSSEGRGLGLTVTRELLRAMGGELEVMSEPGHGTTATLVLRQAEQAKEAASSGLAGYTAEAPTDNGPDASVDAALADASPPTQRHEADPAATNSGLTAPMTVLYVEDNRLNATVMRQAVRRLQSIRLFVAPSAEAALMLMREMKPDLMLIDINLPGISGIELRRQLSTLPTLTDIPCVAVSADATSETKALAAAAGFAAYVAKPFRIEQITRILTSFRDTRKLPAQTLEHSEPVICT